MHRRLGVLALLMLVAGLLMSLAAPSATAQQPERKIRIGVSIPAADHGRTAGVGWWARRAISLYPEIAWSYTAADKSEEQVAAISDALASITCADATNYMLHRGYALH